MKRIIVASVLALTLNACGPVMEFNRPDPVDLTQFHPGQRHIDVVKVLGAPGASVPDGDKSCDVYQLFTRGPDGAGKAGIAFVEGAADIVTLGLAEIIWTPVEAGTKNSLHAVTMCYGKDSVLLSIDEAGAPSVAATTPVAAATSP